MRFIQHEEEKPCPFLHLVSHCLYYLFHNLQVQDSFPYSVGFSLNGGPTVALSNSVLFPKGHPFPSVKMLSLQRSNTFQLEAFYSNQNELPPGVPAKISNFLVYIFALFYYLFFSICLMSDIYLHLFLSELNIYACCNC